MQPESFKAVKKVVDKKKSMRNVAYIMKVRPTQKMRKLIDLYGGISRAATAWDIEYLSLRRFMEGGSMSLPTAAKIVEESHLPYDELFEHKEEEAKR